MGMLIIKPAATGREAIAIDRAKLPHLEERLYTLFPFLKSVRYGFENGKQMENEARDWSSIHTHTYTHIHTHTHTHTHTHIHTKDE